MQDKIQGLINELQAECENIAQEYKRELNSDYALGEYSGLKYAIRKLNELIRE